MTPYTYPPTYLLKMIVEDREIFFFSNVAVVNFP